MKKLIQKSCFILGCLFVLGAQNINAKSPVPNDPSCDTYDTTTVSACTSYTWVTNGLTYTASGTYTYTSLNASGCTNTSTLNLTVGPKITSMVISFTPVPPNSCGTNKLMSFSTSDNCLKVIRTCWPPTQDTLSKERDIVNDSLWQVFKIVDTCHGNCFLYDSFQVSHINTGSVKYQIQFSCDSFTWPEDGITYTSSGLYTHTSTSAAGCTETSTLNLTIGHSTNNTNVVTACGSYTWPVTGITYTVSGTYTYTVINSTGCISTDILILTISNVCNVPTLSEWSLIILFLLSLSSGLVFMYRKERTLSFVNGNMKDNQMPLLDKELFTKVLLAILALLSIIGAFVYKINGSISITDLIGSIVASVILAFIIQLFLLMKRFEKKE